MARIKGARFAERLVLIKKSVSGSLVDFSKAGLRFQKRRGKSRRGSLTIK